MSEFQMAEFNISVFYKLKVLRVFRVWNDVGKNHEIWLYSRWLPLLYLRRQMSVFQKNVQKSTRTFEHFPCPGVTVQGGLCHENPPYGNVRRYASYWNAFLCELFFRVVTHG